MKRLCEAVLVAVVDEMLKICEHMTLSSLRDELRLLAVEWSALSSVAGESESKASKLFDTATPGLRGAPRHHALRNRLLRALRASADAADAADVRERAELLGGIEKVDDRRERGAAKLRAWVNQHHAKHLITDDD